MMQTVCLLVAPDKPKVIFLHLVASFVLEQRLERLPEQLLALVELGQSCLLA
jgi:hypothetical protein